MRNILEYPVTKKEVIETIYRMQKYYINQSEPAIGDLNAFILGLSLGYLIENMPDDWNSNMGDNIT